MSGLKGGNPALFILCVRRYTQSFIQLVCLTAVELCLVSDVEDKFKMLTFHSFVMYIAMRYHLVCKACRRKNLACTRKLCASTSVLQTQMYLLMCCSSVNNIKCKNNEIPIYHSLLLNTVYFLSRYSFYQTRHVANYCSSF